MVKFQLIKKMPINVSHLNLDLPTCRWNFIWNNRTVLAKCTHWQHTFSRDHSLYSSQQTLINWPKGDRKHRKSGYVFGKSEL